MNHRIFIKRLHINTNKTKISFTIVTIHSQQQTTIINMQRPRSSLGRNMNVSNSLHGSNEKPTSQQHIPGKTRPYIRRKSTPLALCFLATFHMLKAHEVGAFAPLGRQNFPRTKSYRSLQFQETTCSLSMIEKAVYEVDANGQPVKTYTVNAEAEESSTVMKKRIVKLLSDDQGEEDDEIPDYSEEAANEVADKKIYSRISEEAKWKANTVMQKETRVNSISGITRGMNNGVEPMIEKKIRAKPPTKVMASVKETGGDSMSEYIKSMGQHELLPQESELLLGRHIQQLVKWEGIRSELEKELDR